MLSPQLILGVHDKIVVDIFAGAGGMSTGIELAIGRYVDDAINHNADALSLHQVNHPQTRHHIKDVREACPHKVAAGRLVGGLHLSPDCTQHSQAKGGQPRDEEIRALSWVGVHWAGTVRPDLITLENVKEILRWGPLIAKRCKDTGRVVKLDGSVAAPGEIVPRRQQYLIPDPKRAGRTWARFVALLRGMGYAVEWRVLCAADYGAPTTRRRLFLIARCDGLPIVWPEPTHHQKPARGQKRWRAAAEAIDFSIPCPSIFGRERPLADATLRRVAHGMRKYVLESADPFIVEIANWSRTGLSPVTEPLRTVTAHPKGGAFAVAQPVLAPAIVQAAHGDGKPGGVQRWGSGAHDPKKPLGTVTASGSGGHAVAAATLVQVSYGERDGQAPRSLDIEQPLGTVVAGGIKHALASAFMVQANGGFNTQHARDARAPMSTVTSSGSQQQLTMAHLIQLRTNCGARDLTEPLRTVSAGGEHHALVEYQLAPEHEAGALRCAAFLMRYHGHGGQWADLRDPMTTVTTKDRLALVTVWLRGEPYVIVDIGLRMLTPRELANASGFPSHYVIDRGHDGRRFTKSQQVKFIGNAVPPLLGYAVWAANYYDQPALRRAA